MRRMSVFWNNPDLPYHVLVTCKVLVPCSALKQGSFSPFPPSKLTRMSQKYPKAPFGELVKMVHDVKDVYRECCEGDMVECVDDWVSSLF